MLRDQFYQCLVDLASRTQLGREEAPTRGSEWVKCTYSLTHTCLALTSKALAPPALRTQFQASLAQDLVHPERAGLVGGRINPFQDGSWIFLASLNIKYKNLKCITQIMECLFFW